EVLRQSEERFRLIVDGVKDYAIIMLDRAGKVAAWNAAAETIYGYTAREAIGSHFSKFYTAEDMTRQWPEHELMVARGEGRIVDDLLDVSRITGGKIALKKEILDLNAAVSHALESCRPLLEARRHTVELGLSDEPLQVDADATRLSQVLLNLINNAVKYTPEGGRVWLETRRENDVAVLRVRDNGIGISAALLPKVFDLFVQGDRSLDRTEGGLGIGLTLVRRLVE